MVDSQLHKEGHSDNTRHGQNSTVHNQDLVLVDEVRPSLVFATSILQELGPATKLAFEV